MSDAVTACAQPRSGSYVGWTYSGVHPVCMWVKGILCVCGGCMFFWGGGGTWTFNNIDYHDKTPPPPPQNTHTHQCTTFNKRHTCKRHTRVCRHMTIACEQHMCTLTTCCHERSMNTHSAAIHQKPCVMGTKDLCGMVLSRSNALGGGG